MKNNPWQHFGKPACWQKKFFSFAGHGFYGQLKQKKKISYDQAAYILTGEAEPFVTPRPNLGPWYHRKFGDYLNVLDAQKHCLFTVRYSQENLNLLMEKCIHAQLMDIQTYRAKEKNH